MSMICPCKGCTKRHVGCHGQCDEYQTWSKNKQEENAKLRQAKTEWNDHYYLPTRRSSRS